jgi:ADP-heptose:LPS heptosyltransferase
MRRQANHIPFASKSLSSFKSQPIQQRTPKNVIPAILISRQTGGIGDMLMITPSIKAIKEANPDTPIILSTSSAYGGGRGVLIDILKYNPYIDKVISVDKIEEYDFKKTYDFGSGREVAIEARTNENRIDIFARLAELELKDKQTIYVVSESEKQWAKKWITDRIPPERRKLIGIQVHTTTAKRNWPEEKSLLLAFQIANTWKDTSILLFYEGLTEIKSSTYVNIYPIVRLPIRWVAALINECEIFVSPDSGLLHIAGALKKKTLGIFGSIKPESRLSYYPNAQGVYLYYPCSPCWYKTCENHYECLRNIDTNLVLNRVEKFLGKPIAQDKTIVLPKKLKKTKKSKERVLVIRMGGMGDIACLSSSLKTFKKENKDSIVDLATMPENVHILKGVSFLDDVFSLNDIPKKVPYDRTFDLRYGAEGERIGEGKLLWNIYMTQDRSDIFDSLMGVKGEKEFEVVVDADALKTMKKRIKSLKGRIVLINPTTKGDVRAIPVEYIEPLCEMILGIPSEQEKSGDLPLREELKKPREKLSIIIAGTDMGWGDYIRNQELKEDKRILNLLGKTSVQEIVALVNLSDIVICPDAGLMHIAGALKVNCVAIFGNIDPQTRVKYYPSVFPLYPKGEFPCIPCGDIPAVAADCKKRVRPTHTPGAACMKLITPGRIYEAAKEVLNIKDGRR